MLDESSNNVSGQIFYLTDDNPVNCYYVLAPLYRILKHREIPNPIPVPIIVQLVFAFFFHVLSLLLGPKFKLPYWGFTFMECYKVSQNLSILMQNIIIFQMRWKSNTRYRYDYTLNF